MAMIERPSPKGKRVSLFVTCMVDMLSPQTGMSVVAVLEHLGLTVDFPAGQTCCGQPAFNSGYWDESRQVARHFIETFREAEVIVTPSGSCAAMVYVLPICKQHCLKCKRPFATTPATDSEYSI